MAVSDVLAPDLCRMGGPDNQQIVLGRRLLSAATRKRQLLSSGRACVGVQVDPYPLPLLDHPTTLRRDYLSKRKKAGVTTSKQSQTESKNRLTDHLRA